MFFGLLTLASSLIDAYTMGKEITDLIRFQHQTGGFYDTEREANARDTYRAVWLAATYGAFPYIEAKTCFRWIQTLHNRDGGASLTPGSKSSIYGTYLYFVMSTMIAPESIDIQRIIDYLHSNYDMVSGLFKDTPESQPSIEATYYAYQLLSRFHDSDTTWLNTFATKNFITDLLVEDHFEIEGVSPIKAQLYAGSIAKFISLSIPYHRISEYVISKLNSQIKEGKLDNEEAAAGARFLYFLGGEAFPISLVHAVKLSGSLADLYYANVILSASGEISKFFEIKVLCGSVEGNMFDIEKEGVKVQQVIHPVIAVTSLGRFVNPLMRVNVTTLLGDEAPYTETLQIDYKTGLYNAQRFASVNKLGQMGIDVVAWFTTEMGIPLVITKSVRAHVSLPVYVSCEAYLQADEIIPIGGVVSPGVNFNVKIEGKFDDSIEVQPTTAVTFQITDSAGAILYHKNEDFKTQLEFTYQLPSLAIPIGNLKVIIEIGDKVNGIHTHKEFSYKVEGTMSAINVELPTDLKLSDVLKVKMTPALEIGQEFVPFQNEEIIKGELTDASGEAFYPQTSSETQQYKMRIKVGDSVIKTIDGDVKVDKEKKLYVEFESNVDENLDIATGFTVDFLFNSESNEPILLQQEKECFIKVSTTIIAEGDKIVTNDLKYGDKLKLQFVLKDKENDKVLTSTYAYPVIVILNPETKNVLLEKKAKLIDDKYNAKAQITGAIPSGEITIAIMIRKGKELVPVNTESGLYQSKVKVIGSIDIKSKVIESAKYLIVDYNIIVDNKKLPSGALKANIYDKQGDLVDVVPLTQKKRGSRLSYSTEALNGACGIELRRIGEDDNEKPIYTQRVVIERSISELVMKLPIEGIATILAFVLFAWSIKLREHIKA
ncbi:hypothetical protein GPJ56_008078 [Histomonas meleagridis]|uniref:uncharacterized protein n=1 Tax=Histomonas meleagridis TaxID=135588 RepID=UPI00355AAAA2|nr:hypothetical protein GPJ56_008078 [Histomonas meleagridis]KAH0798971.1 hypothetical protein GO595_008261 [Histomonas meleagridis]